MSNSQQTALVLGGGGPVGASWMAALVHELVANGVPLGESDVVLGTSAGSVVGAWLTIEPDGVATVPNLMRERAQWHARNAASRTTAFDPGIRQKLGFEKVDPESARGVGQAAIAAIPPISVHDAELMWKPMLPKGPWPSQLGMAAVDANTGEARVWSAKDDIPLTVGVSCSTAAPGAAPPVEVAGSVWVDGGVRSGTNADLVDIAPGRVLVVSPMASDRVRHEEAILTEHGHRVRVITATPFTDSPADMLNPRFIDAGVTAGTTQARDLAADLLAWWN
ncbi:patatin-like phospholipase family protein [Kutzneria sp. NPDC051319]|uniref:patatin-like phospholipase family protein n=1 Tax=Kutzneria sp. NPDC051319 TaxID=3155047 RepID=UPI0034171E04